MSAATRRPFSPQTGLSMIEMLLVVAILGVLFAILLMTLGTGQVSRARDAERKDDLQTIKVAFEEYYNDNGCYPPPEILDNCNSSDLAPYISVIPCDPGTEQAYVYVPYPDQADTCGGYRIYAALEQDTDRSISELDCSGGCGVVTAEMLDSTDPNAPADYNYGVSEGIAVADPSGASDPGVTYTSCCPAGQGACQAYTEGFGTCNGGILYETYQECRDASNGCY